MTGGIGLGLPVARVLRPDGCPIGTAFLAARDRLLTVAHVVNLATGREPDNTQRPDGIVELDFPLLSPGNRMTAEVDHRVPSVPDVTFAGHRRRRRPLPPLARSGLWSNRRPTDPGERTTMDWHILITLGLAALPIVITPGTSIMLVAQYVSTGGRRHGVAVMAGTATGHFLHAGFATVGLSALIMASATAFAIVRYAGAAYLVGLGIHLLVRSGRKPDAAIRTRPATPVTRVYRHALLGNVLNPRPALVYLTVPAQVVAVDFPVAAAAFLLAVVHTTMMVSWLTMWTQAIGAAKRSRAFTVVSRRFSRFGGLLLIGLGVRTAVSD